MAGKVHGPNVLSAGAAPGAAKAAMILLHGRGASAANILSLASAFGRSDIIFLAPEAAGNAWYPHPFLRPRDDNQPSIDEAHAMLDGLVAQLGEEGLPAERVVIGGFSQGACLSLDYAAHRPRRHGGVVAFAGGLIGTADDFANLPGSLHGTPVFLGCGDQDPFIPVSRVEETATAMRALGAALDLRIYPGLGHTIGDDEIAGGALVLEKAAQ